MEEDEINPHIIIDNGSGYFKAGFSGDEGPKLVFPSCVGYPKYASDLNKDEFFVGEDAISKRGVLKLNYPINHGIINNWNDMEKIWHHALFNGLKVPPEDYNIMLTEPILNPKENRGKMAEIMFETYNVSGLYIENPTTLGLYSAGKFSGIVVDSGEGITQIVPIFDGYSISPGINRFNFAGKNLTKIMQILLNENEYKFSTPSELEIVKSIKEKACYVALDYEEEIKSIEPFDYELPDGTHCITKDERIRCTEALFKPSIFSNDDDELSIKWKGTSYKESNILEKDKGLGYACFDSIQKCDIDVRKDLYNCIVLSGGNSMFNGLPERLTKEIKMLAPESMKEEVKVIASPETKFAAWIGGSILSTISSFKTMLITKEEYEESGVAIIHKKTH